MITPTDGGTPATNGAAGEDAAKTLRRTVLYDAVAALEADGVKRPAAFRQVAEERGTSASNVSGAYYTERRRRLEQLADDVGDPAAMLMEAVAVIEAAVADAKLTIAAATMAYERLRADAALAEQMRKLIR